MPSRFKDDFQKDFECAIRTLQIVLVYCLLFAGFLAWLFYVLWPIVGSFGSVGAIIIGLGGIVYFFGRTVKQLKVLKKRKSALHCAYCKDPVLPPMTMICGKCGALYH